VRFACLWQADGAQTSSCLQLAAVLIAVSEQQHPNLQEANPVRRDLQTLLQGCGVAPIKGIQTENLGGK